MGRKARLRAEWPFKYPKTWTSKRYGSVNCHDFKGYEVYLWCWDDDDWVVLMNPLSGEFHKNDRYSNFEVWAKCAQFRLGEIKPFLNGLQDDPLSA